MQIRTLLQTVALTALLATLGSISGKAQVLLTVDISNPSAVVITSTGTATSSNVSGYNYDNDGITLAGFFAPAIYTYGSTSTPNSLTTYTNNSGTASSYHFDSWENDNISTSGGAEVDLNLYDFASHTDHTSNLSFFAGQSAFVPSSSITLDLSGLDLTGVGGNLYAGYSTSHAQVIGSYSIVGAPEPSTWAMLFAGVAGLSLWARARRVA